ncbi:hypothetical protein FOCG_07389 [Fusarium oxysporum f. sp. radicis-lycopersici 26381]|uniref:Uncharacterized protein n=3 Tax=Fusarium oxysporum TaxID=5507 RepID=A0A420T2K8_FUSOX|nr:hypothetical protein FOZG_04438 [Fusarium oxysporum Fo47]EXL54319.1 hypothetical protein FOCG_07389 [Fusarium oxysporum f. sp. radicis-lycopersici 26381]KAF5256858.1 hypothetical protein FOXYS1_12643 [Fusarium oxysporum]KAJ4124867.1 hypothetical protein NW765_014395 [Fusarium oxysporum]KAJ4263687.1 hypothetical protein NW764_016097 [Fusarium oxysporum]
MPPMLHFVRRAFDPGLPSSEFSNQWKHPSDVFSVLLILGGDVVARALAQLVGSRFTPVAFSFGWVAYAITAVVSAIGENKLMPPADFSCMVINGETGYTRDNHSWIIGRMVRDFETWMDQQPLAGGLPALPPGPSPNPVQTCVEDIIELKWEELRERAKKKEQPEPERPPKAGLCVSVYKAQEATKGYPGYDAPYIAGFLTCIVQLGVAAIPCGIFGDWSILVVTAAGIVLSFASGALPQWSKEKWACRIDTEKTFVLTRGNGSQHAIVIQGAGVGLDLEDLSAADTGAFADRGTRLIVIALGFLWILLLITASGIRENTWFLLAVGGMGILQNIYVAGTSRPPEAFGVPLEFVEVMGNPKVMDTLFKVEERYPRLGKSMLPIFFTGELRENEQKKWDNYEKIAKEIKEKAKREKEPKKEEVSNNFSKHQQASNSGSRK